MDNKERDYRIDSIKGVLIFLVVLGHCLLPVAQKGEGLCYAVYSAIYIFHMPLFMMISGYMTNQPTKESLLHTFYLFLGFNGFYYLLSFAAGDAISPWNPAYSMWYLLVLFLCRVCVLLFSDIKLRYWWAAGLILYVFLQCVAYEGLFLSVKFGFFFLYFLAGYTLKKKPFLLAYLRDEKNRGVQIGACVLSSFLLILTMFAARPGWTFLHHGDAVRLPLALLSFYFFLVLCLFLLSVYSILPDKRNPVSFVGERSLVIYLLHRAFTLFFPVFTTDGKWFALSVILSIVICAVCIGIDFGWKKLKTMEEYGRYTTRKFVELSCVVCFVVCLLFGQLFSIETRAYDYEKPHPEVAQSELDQYIKVSYVGDLLLFKEDMNRIVRNSSEEAYYRQIFDSVSSYLGDYSIGTFEGVVGTESWHELSGDYYDNQQLHLSYTDTFARVASEYFDFLNINMNHLYDNDEVSVDRTRRVLTENGVSFVDPAEESSVCVVAFGGVRCAVLSYCDFMNYGDGEVPYGCLDEERILSDIQKAHSYGVDMIIAMTHCGEQFSHEASMRQKYWHEFMARNGVNIILGGHPHVVQPIEYIGETLVVNCPGNFVTSLSGQDQEYGMICNFYVDPSKNRAVYASVVPIKSVVSADSLEAVTCYELNDIAGANMVLDNAIGVQVINLQPEYFWNADGYHVYVDDKSTGYPIFPEQRVCFIGDSITAGTFSNGRGWYEYLDCGEKLVLAKGGVTTSEWLKEFTAVPEADVYVIALGTNDIRYSGLSAADYIYDLDQVANLLPAGSLVVCVAPWYTTRGDNLATVPYNERLEHLKTYGEALEAYCTDRGYACVNINDALMGLFSRGDERLYTIDGIHPTHNVGIREYSRLFYVSLSGNGGR